MIFTVARVNILGFEWYQVQEGDRVLHQFSNEIFAFRRKDELERKRLKEMKPAKSSNDKILYYWLKNG